MNKDIYKAAHQSSARYAKDISEFDEVGLTPEYVDGIDAPFVAESRLKMGLKLVEKIDLTHNPTHFVIGEIIYVELDDSVIDEGGTIRIQDLGTVTASGLDLYHETALLDQLPYPKVN